MSFDFFSWDFRPKEIAQRLFITQKTVHNHLFNSRKKLNIRKTSEIFRIAKKEKDILTENIYLTQRWREILDAYTEGLSDKQIAEQIGISYSTVRRHKERMQNANNCTSMRELCSQYKKNINTDEE